ncbi:MAG: DUF4197 domain-containing protein [Bacteroidetes bacterium]|nr:DUF4197 domain-containing protein [Bacteroidota bacterium]
MRNLVLVVVLFSTIVVNGQINVNSVINTITGSNGASLTNDEVVKGLKEALTVGTNNSTAKASKLDGFYKNTAIKIPFPPEVKQVDQTLRNLGMNKQVDQFVMTLNRAAEEAAKDAAPIFIAAVTQMSIMDGISILKGGDNAATQYLQQATMAQLKAQFKPKVAAALKKVHVTKYWNPLAKKYNKLPMVQKINPDLESYVTDRAIQGLFKLVAEEELKIRKDPAARVTDILKKVFGFK